MKKSQLIPIIQELVKETLGPKSDIEYITPAEAADLIYKTGGSMFDVVFTKKDGTDRRMNARLGVKKYLKGGTLKFDPKERGYIVVYDVQCGLKAQSDDDKACYRMININTLKSLRIKGRKYVIRPEDVKEQEAPSPYALKLSDSPKFNSLPDLLRYVLDKGIDPSTRVLIKGQETGETVMDFIVP